ncbi:MAG: O-antigen ligase family protein [Candidatus Omnitrophica bacterium]|nr:O-antigen ligase family protein [Candidatus Omnitrophota bacterium]
MEILQRKRVFFPFVTPNALGGFLAMIIPLALGVKGKTWISIPLGIALIMTKSLGALIALSAALILFTCVTGQKHKKLRLVILLLGLTVLGVFAARSIFSQINSTPEFSTLMRLTYWGDTLEIIKKHPFLGIGPGNFDLTQTRYAHNTYLQIWAESGIFEITSFICLAAAIIRAALTSVKNSAFKRLPAGILTACVAFLLHNLFDFTFFLPEISFIWWAIAGLNFTSSADH